MARYCAACAEDVAPIDDPASQLVRCPGCGLALGTMAGSGQKDVASAEPWFKTVLVAEDTRLTREIVKVGLVEAGLAGHVFVAEDGQQFLRLFTEHAYRDQPVDLCILDLEMPVLDGASTAVAMRAIEQGCAARPAPVIFFTGHPINDNIRSYLRFCKPAHYLNKGQDASPPRIVKRLREVMRALQM
ncbi:MAG: response regulator [Myxococcaceae bacterium]|nr:response regulator [Myxococcaceae bacterium]